MKSRIVYLGTNFICFYLVGLVCSYFINDKVNYIYALIFAILVMLIDKPVNKLIKKFIPTLNKQNEK